MLNEVSHSKLGQLIIPNDYTADEEERRFPYDYIMYNYYRTNKGTVIYQEYYDYNRNKKTVKMLIPDAVINDITNMEAKDFLEDE